MKLRFEKLQFDKITFPVVTEWLLIGLVVLLPIFFLPISWLALAQTKMTLVAIVVALLGLAWTVSTSVGGKVSVPKSLMVAVGAALPVVYLVSALLSRAPHALVGSGSESDTAAAMVLWFALMAATAAILTTGNLVARAYRALLVSAVVVEFFQLFGFIVGTRLTSFIPWTSPAASIVGSWHDFAIFLGFAIVLAAASFESNLMAGRWRWLNWAVFVLAFPLLVIVNATDVWIAVAVLGLLGTVYAWFLGWRRHGQEGDAMAIPHRFTFGIFITIFLFATSFVFIGSTVSSILPVQWRVVQTEIRPSWQGTAAVATSVYRGGGLIFGSGPNTFQSQWGLYKPTGVNETAFWNADFVQGVGFVPTAFITVGALGALAWIAFLLFVLVTSVRLIFSKVINDRAWRMPTFALAMAAVYLWAMMVVYTPGITLIALAFITTGILAAAGRAAHVTETLSWEFARSKYGFAFVLIPVCVVLGIGAASAGVGRALAADMLVNQSITAYNTTGNATVSQAMLNQALAIDPTNDRALRGAVELNLVRFNQLAQSATSSAQVKTELQDALQQAISNGLSAVSSDSTNYQNWLTLAGAYQQLAGVQVAGAYDNAKKAYQQALAANPSNPQPYLQLAQLAALQSDASSTRAYIMEALNKKSNYADAYYLLSQLDASQNDLKGAFAAAVSAVQSDQTQPVLWLQLGTVAYAQADYADAISALQQAVALNANYANALYILGLSYYKNNDAADALATFERVASLNPDNQSINQIVSLLKEGKPLPTGTAGPAASSATTAAAH